MIPELSEQRYRSVAGSAGIVSWPGLFKYRGEEGERTKKEERRKRDRHKEHHQYTQDHPNIIFHHSYLVRARCLTIACALIPGLSP
jgi:hypothetical protein